MQGFTPAVSDTEALSVSWTQEGAPGTPSSEQATLALLTNIYFGGPHTESPVWLVTYEGACIHHFAAQADATCASSEFNVLIDATTGDYIASFSFR